MEISAAATVVPVTDLEASIQFFIETLGFKEEFRHDGYVGLERDNCLVHLSRAGNPNTGSPGSASVYLFCDDVDSIHQNLIERGVSMPAEPQDYSYGMRDFVVADLDGNKFSFGSPDIKPQDA